MVLIILGFILRGLIKNILDKIIIMVRAIAHVKNKVYFFCRRNKIKLSSIIAGDKIKCQSRYLKTPFCFFIILNDGIFSFFVFEPKIEDFLVALPIVKSTDVFSMSGV